MRFLWEVAEERASEKALGEKCACFLSFLVLDLSVSLSFLVLDLSVSLVSLVLDHFIH